MNRRLIVGFLLATVVGLTNTGLSQCGPANVSLTSYGAGCGPGVTTAVLGAQYDVVDCVITFTLTIPPIGFSTFPEAHVLAFGSMSTTLPLPNGPNCTVLNNALIVHVQPSGANVFSYDVPPQLVGMTIYVQGANIWIDSFCFCPLLQLTQGLSVNFY